MIQQQRYSCTDSALQYNFIQNKYESEKALKNIKQKYES